jgi:hypothetical protein
MDQNPSEKQKEEKTQKQPKKYIKPEILHELELEIRAGSPVPGNDDLLDPFSGP